VPAASVLPPSGSTRGSKRVGLEARRLDADARRDLSEMSDRELLDVGLVRSDISDVARGGSPRSIDECIKAITFAASMRS
jgi:hypothetical protein